MDLKQQAQQLLSDPTQLQKRNEEIIKVFELAKLTNDEMILVFDKINNHQALQIALGKLKPFITLI